jgi:hypothetical protein
MRLPRLQPVIALGFLIGCAGQSIKPAEVLDERTGMTVAALQEPIELVQGAQRAPLPGDARRPSFAYLGPVEWNQMGHISYGLWVHVAPGNDRQVANIRAPGAVTLELDEGPMVLVVIEAPKPGHSPYQPVVSWGQAAYFEMTAQMLKRIAASQKLELNIRAMDDSAVGFSPSSGTSGTLTQFAHSRGIATDD